MRHEARRAIGRSRASDSEALAVVYDGLSAKAIVERALTRDLADRIALVSSFGAESAVLLHMVAEIDPATPVLFLDTGKLFHDTQVYRRELTTLLGLSDVRLLRPDSNQLAAHDPRGDLHRSDVANCCYLRKVAPLERGLAPFDAWITGRKRTQSTARAALSHVETDPKGRIKLNPLAHWTGDEISAYMTQCALPRHALVARGYPSIGCAPCTTPVSANEHVRDGRWRGQGRDECGIHVVGGRVAREVNSVPME